ncbi:hypothetical protein GON03_03310 [Nocardioides sp. MAH-18]|uniref:Uncharacterized protein n=1 Tax=Nocardioides agri TaxID=2682843 RepID=A0A6L6XNM5_9ACTN|nr:MULTISPECIES: hypothetical protein [unclassified Nocardioides]MBA2953328.1 hypothetical protein [Nocardioides sp. CGMCC 1.13656]MVQ48196.1 hypothetical protein [Nocardioides sp. MAH-18]
MTEYSPNACLALGRIADEISAGGPSGHEFLVELGYRVAGIPRGWQAWAVLATGGRSRIRGHGFRAELFDGTGGQARHFAGTARAVTLLGEGATLWISAKVRRDSEDSPDGQLTRLAVDFAAALLDGSLPAHESGDWIRDHLCA